MRRTLFDRLYHLPHYYRTTTYEFWRSLTDFELKLTNTPVKLPPEVDTSKYSAQLLQPHFYHTRFLDSFMLQYFNSKPVEGLVYGEQLMLVSGPDKIGKTTFIRNSLEQFKEAKNRKNVPAPLSSYEELPERVDELSRTRRMLDSAAETMVVEIDFGDKKEMGFLAFVDCVERRIMEEILTVVARFEGKGKVLLTEKVLLKLILLRNHPAFVRTYAKDTLVEMMDELDDKGGVKEKLMKCKIFKGNSSVAVTE